jgi:hypothetical protein
MIETIKAGIRIGAVANDSQTDRAGLNAAQNALNDQLNDDWNDDSNTAYSTALTHPVNRSRGFNLTPRWNIRRRTCAASRAAASRTERRVRQDDR